MTATVRIGLWKVKGLVAPTYCCPFSVSSTVRGARPLTAGIAHVATMFGTPFIAVKAITDIVDGDKPTHDEFLQNLGAAAKALQGAVPKVLEFVAGKKLDEL